MSDNVKVTAQHESVCLDDMVQGLTAEFARLWWDCPATLPCLGPAYTLREQFAREAHLERFWAVVTDELSNLPRTAPQRLAIQERILAAFVPFARDGLGWRQEQVEFLLRGGFVQVAADFGRAARQVDPAVTGSDIFQASRNAWTMNGLQVLVGLPVRLTPSVLAYSMLYPCTDNYLDDPGVSEEAKVSFNGRFVRRLAGEHLPANDAREQIVFDLVDLIEGQYCRSQHPLVYQSLLAIHRAQELSVRLLRRRASPYEVDVLGISLLKGGTSVLADGYLVAGSLTMAQARFTYGWGAFLQLADDLQDVVQDGRDGLLTVFSQTARRWPLDHITSRALHYGHRVLQLLDSSGFSGSEHLSELMRMAAIQLLLTAAGRARRWYTQRYIRDLESHSPFRFSFLDRHRRKLARQRLSFARLVEAFAVSESSSV